MNSNKVTRLSLVLAFFSFLNQVNADQFTHLSGSGNNQPIDKQNFTTTMKWSADFLKFTKSQPKFLPRNWQQIITIPNPPANSSLRTQAEINYLKTLTSKRKANIRAIKAEVISDNLKLGSYTYLTLTNKNKYPDTSKLILAAHRELAIACFTMKKKYNRIRPSILNKELGHAIAIPPHPAYPSGHATQAYTVAYLLQQLDPAKADNYIKDARRISHNREIAGLHYPSDSEAGRLLARQLVDYLSSQSSFKRLIAKAKKEW